MIITFHNFKGGTGNTTLVAHPPRHRRPSASPSPATAAN
jgi:hypothetical protein